MDVDEFEIFLMEYERDLFSFCRHLTMDRDLASELYQETALSAFEMRMKIDTNNNPKSLLFSIAVGKWKNMYRKHARRQVIAPEVSLDFAGHVATESDTESSVLRGHVNESIGSALAEIDDKFRLPLILHYFDDMPLDAIGKVLKIPSGTVKSRLHKGRALLKKSLEEEGINYV